MVFKEHKVGMVHKVIKVQLVNKAGKVNKVQLVLKDGKVNKVQLAHKAGKDNKDQLAHKAGKEKEDNLDNLLVFMNINLIQFQQAEILVQVIYPGIVLIKQELRNFKSII